AQVEEWKLKYQDAVKKTCCCLLFVNGQVEQLQIDLTENRNEVAQSRQALLQLHLEMFQKLVESESKYEKEVNEHVQRQEQDRKQLEHYKKVLEEETNKVELLRLQLKQHQQTTTLKEQVVPVDI
ncbi:hypothetical protein RFI_08184, partial [Reticulomyxa filosa]